jgi:hypothetical protein
MRIDAGIRRFFVPFRLGLYASASSCTASGSFRPCHAGTIPYVNGNPLPEV